jgi:hypothetical protein
LASFSAVSQRVQINFIEKERELWCLMLVSFIGGGNWITRRKPFYIIQQCMYIVFSLQCQKPKATAKQIFVAFDFPNEL